MLSTFVRFEIKNLLRDDMTRVMLFYPIMLGGLARLLLHRHLLTSQFAAVTAVVLVILASVRIARRVRAARRDRRSRRSRHRGDPTTTGPQDLPTRELQKR